jgi:uncharacterized membrane protein YfcA
VTGGLLFLFVSSLLAGAINSIAGGGSLLSFPAAVAAGLAPIVANATNTVAVIPGSLAGAWGFRKHLDGLGRLTAVLCIPAVLGSLVGASILRHTPQRVFDGVVPWLVLGATAVIFVKELWPRRPGRAQTQTQPAQGAMPQDRIPPLPPLFLGLQFLTSIYGGYFGAAIGLIMLAFLSFLPQRLGLHQMNGVKNVLAVVVNSAAAIDFLLHGLVDGPAVLVMAVGAATGGVLGGRWATRVDPRRVRWLVVAIGVVMAALLGWRAVASTGHHGSR